jgi:hypothetical protein
METHAAACCATLSLALQTLKPPQIQMVVPKVVKVPTAMQACVPPAEPHVPLE